MTRSTRSPRSTKTGLSRRLLSIAAVAAVGVSAFAATPAVAAPADDQLVSADPANNTPRVLTNLDGSVSKVMAIARSGDTMIVGGTFTQVRESDPAAPVVNRVGLFAFNATTGAIDPNFNPILASSSPDKPVQVSAIQVSADGNSVYIGGEFRTINGSGPARLQELSLSDGQKVPSFSNPTPNLSVFDLKLVGNRLYVAGSFTKLDTTARGGLASLDATTGALTDAVTTSYAGINNGGITTVRKIDVTPTGDRMITIGNFTTVGGIARNQVAMLDTSGPTATVAGWSTNRFPRACSSSFDTYLRDVDFSPDGSFFVIVTTGGWGGTGSTCDSASRFETYRTGVQDYTWIDFTGGDTFWAVEVTQNVVYAGGHFRWMNNSYTSDGRSAGPGAVPREGLAALDTRNGLPFSWDPGRKRGIGVFDFLLSPSGLWAGSDTDTWAGEKRDRLALFPFLGGKNLPTDKLGTLPGDVVQLDSDAVTGTDARAKYLTGSGVPLSTTPVSSETWSNARGAVMIDGTVYTGWSDGTFKQRSFDGVNFGVPSNVDLHGGGFSKDIPKITSMFYDRRDGRLYYTMPTDPGTAQKAPPTNNNGGLYYRYFTPESGTVGTTRFNGLRAASATAIDAANIRGSFLVGDQLYFVDKAGVLKKITFSPGQFVGSATTVNSAIDWRAKGLFASTAASASAPNTNPTAAYTVNCFGLDCSFNGSTSSDPDGSIVDYAWNFGDTGTGSGQQAAHTFAAGGTYPVSLKVTDNRGGTNTISTNVTVSPVNTSIVPSASGTYASSSKATHNWTVPAGVDAGDTMLLFVSGTTAATPSTPAGWTQEANVLDSDTRTVVFSKTATGADAGSPLSVTWSDAGTTKSTGTVMSLAAYSGVADISSVVGDVEGSVSGAASHVTPDSTVGSDGDWVVSYWSDKNASTTDWTEPFGQSVLSEAIPAVAAGNIRVTGLLTDDGGPAPDGPRAGMAATANGEATKGTMFTVVLATN
ncbi:MAG TPA: PKD domain-containing protein [Actinomycetes bacterium]|nr:PKD domain-containing protein [Actinomycetes bacterium]